MAFNSTHLRLIKAIRDGEVKKVKGILKQSFSPLSMLHSRVDYTQRFTDDEMVYIKSQYPDPFTTPPGSYLELAIRAKNHEIVTALLLPYKDQENHFSQKPYHQQAAVFLADDMLTMLKELQPIVKNSITLDAHVTTYIHLFLALTGFKGTQEFFGETAYLFSEAVADMPDPVIDKFILATVVANSPPFFHVLYDYARESFRDRPRVLKFTQKSLFETIRHNQHRLLDQMLAQHFNNDLRATAIPWSFVFDLPRLDAEFVFKRLLKANLTLLTDHASALADHDLVIPAFFKSFDSNLPQVHPGFLDHILDAGIHVNQTWGEGGMTALMLIAQLRPTAQIHTRSLTDTLLYRGANINLLSQSGRPAIVYALSYQNKDLLLMLLQAGASLDIKDQKESLSDLLKSSPVLLQWSGPIFKEAVDVLGVHLPDDILALTRPYFNSPTPADLASASENILKDPAQGSGSRSGSDELQRLKEAIYAQHTADLKAQEHAALTRSLTAPADSESLRSQTLDQFSKLVAHKTVQSDPSFYPTLEADSEELSTDSALTGHPSRRRVNH